MAVIAGGVEDLLYVGRSLKVSGDGRMWEGGADELEEDEKDCSKHSKAHDWVEEELVWHFLWSQVQRGGLHVFAEVACTENKERGKAE